MSLLLDTHVLLWWLTNNSILSTAARAAIADSQNAVFVSAASIWEISLKQSRGKLDAPSDIKEQLENHGFEPLSITIAHAYAAGALPRHHNDPFDRMLVAQAVAEGMTIVTRDSRILRYAVPTLPA